LVNEEYYYPGGPIFIYHGAGFEVYDNYLQTGLVHDLAQEIGAYIFSIESRYYGQSRPTK
jgi:thymus-specific serine protease